MTTTWHLPVKPYSPITALNRRAAALGSPRTASAAEHADYNGHQVNVAWNNYRGYYVAEYFWAGRVVLARGDFRECLDAAVAEYNKGALGASVSITLRAGDDEAQAICGAMPNLVAGELARGLDAGWWTWKHTVASEAARDSANPSAYVYIFDWDLLQAADSQAVYDAALRAKYGRTHN